MRASQKEIIRLHGLYQCGMSLAKLAKNHGNGLSRQQIFYYFKALSLKTRSKKLKEKIEFNGDFYTRNHFGYCRKTYGDRKHLHRAVWEKHNGAIEPNFDIHHKDGNKENNDISNLEKILKSEHTRLYCVFNNQYTKGKKERTAIVPKCCKNCMIIIQDKGLGPAYYEQREFCSKSCFHDYCKKNGQTIGDIRIKKLEQKLSEAA